jgi:hypothetical protein
VPAVRHRPRRLAKEHFLAGVAISLFDLANFFNVVNNLSTHGGFVAEISSHALIFDVGEFFPLTSWRIRLEG